ncbi:MAG: hypothetical protein KA715_07425 [Xanthomonadaceae bacterium]|nr:hypothetical protein [Xanthomonadaceae bacterium]
MSQSSRTDIPIRHAENLPRALHFSDIMDFGSLCSLMGFRVIRSAGDEKVYVTQAYEMVQQGTWFVQYFQASLDFYKGPFHYWGVVLGTRTLIV